MEIPSRFASKQNPHKTIIPETLLFTALLFGFSPYHWCGRSSLERYSPLPTSHRAILNKKSEMNFPTAHTSVTQNTNSRDTYPAMAVTQRSHAFSGSDWRNLEPIELRSRPRASNVQESLPSIRTMFSGFESQERPMDPEYRHNATPYSPAPTERTYNTSPGSNKRRRLSNDYYDEELQQQQDRYQSGSSSRSPMTAAYGYDSATTSPVSSTARRESLRSVPDTRAYSNQESPYLSRSAREQSILSITERRAAYQDHHTSRPPFHSPISEPSSTTYRPNLPCITTPDRSHDRSYSQTPAGRSHNDHPSRNEYTRSEYALEASRAYQHSYNTTHETYAASQSDYGYQQPRNQPYSSSSYQLNHGQTPFTNGHHSGNYASSPYQTQDLGDSKPRKRRGNLPKPTTDILTGWFVNHLDHPYPNEEEKQLLMRQTGLQLNQISNWFINARRRKLPALQNSARAENAARSHHNRMHSADDGQSPMSLCNSDAGAIFANRRQTSTPSFTLEDFICITIILQFVGLDLDLDLDMGILVLASENLQQESLQHYQDMTWEHWIWDEQQQIPEFGFLNETELA
ncbi:hypothetical protein EYC80_006340 [Monilinia laxa]|uniref:Homeobox domain-containing protein n=1 Tax=Monilinia laxa TaxID=61186 RepID=A0A5N6JRN4_MONLA|nr:hypothetical protein EYC80_006340 [Monilinia laxa]